MHYSLWLFTVQLPYRDSHPRERSAIVLFCHNFPFPLKLQGKELCSFFFQNLSSHIPVSKYIKPFQKCLPHYPKESMRGLFFPRANFVFFCRRFWLTCETELSKGLPLPADSLII